MHKIYPEITKNRLFKRSTLDILQSILFIFIRHLNFVQFWQDHLLFGAENKTFGKETSSLKIVLEMHLVCPWGTLQALRSAVLHRHESLDRLHTSQLPLYPLFWREISDRVCSAENIYMASYSSKSWFWFFQLVSVGFRSGLCYFTEILKFLEKK